MRRILLIAAVVVLGSLAVVTVAIAAGGAAPVIGGRTGPGPAGRHRSPTPPATGATGTDPTQPARVSVVDGTLETVTLTGPKGPVAGTLAADKTAVGEHRQARLRRHLHLGRQREGRRRHRGAARGHVRHRGRRARRSAARSTSATGARSGVAAPIRIQFNGHVADRAAAEQALSVDDLGARRGRVGLAARRGRRLAGRLAAEGVLARAHEGHGHGEARRRALRGRHRRRGRLLLHRSRSATPRSSRPTSTASAWSCSATGRRCSTCPRATASAPTRSATPARASTSSARSSPTSGWSASATATTLVEKWAVRISNNGEFIHANPASTAAQGSANVTHGCVNLSIDNAKAYYDIGAVRRPRRGHRHAGPARRPRRRHLGLDAVVGPVEEALRAELTGQGSRPLWAVREPRRAAARCHAKTAQPTPPSPAPTRQVVSSERRPRAERDDRARPATAPCRPR